MSNLVMPSKRKSVFVWARNRNAAGRGNDPMPQIIYEQVGVSHLEIVAQHDIPAVLNDYVTLDELIARFPPPVLDP